MIGRGLWCLLGVVLVLVMSAPPAFASFGFQSFDSTITNEDGSPAVQAGSHPFAVTTGFKFNTRPGFEDDPVPDGDVKDIEVELPAGVVGDPTATPKCTIRQFNTPNQQESGGLSGANCPNDSQIGVAQVEITPTDEGLPHPLAFGIYNLVAPPGVPAEFGINPNSVPVLLIPKVRTGSDYGVTVVSKHTSQAQRIFGVKTTFWGVPSASSHEGFRGECLGSLGEPFGGESQKCPVEATGKPFLRLPTYCPSGSLRTAIYADSWQDPVANVELEGVKAEAFNHDAEGHPVGITGCERLDFSPTVSAQPDTKAASSPTGMSVEVSLPQNENPTGLAEADLKKAEVSLPSGMSVSPSAANELQGCSEEQIALNSAAPAQCPDASKVGVVEIETPLLESKLEGSVYVAQPNQNKFHSLLALYVVAEGSGVVIKLAGEVHADPATGQLTTTFDNNPQQPFSHLLLKFFGGPRAALMTPRKCGTFNATGALTPWSRDLPAVFSEPIAITTNCGGGFAPSLVAGTVSNQAGGFSPYARSRSHAPTRTRASSSSACARLPACSECSPRCSSAPNRRSPSRRVRRPARSGT